MTAMANPDTRSAVFASLCTLHANLMADGDEDFAREIEMRAVAYARAHPDELSDQTPAAARSGSRAIFAAIPYQRKTVSRVQFSQLMRWARPSDWEMILDRIWPLSTGIAWLSGLLAARQDHAKAFLAALSKHPCLIDPDCPHAIVCSLLWTTPKDKKSIEIASNLLRELVKKHPTESSTELEDAYKHDRPHFAIALALAGAKNLPPSQQHPDARNRIGDASHDRLSLIKKHGDLEEFILRKLP